MSPVTQARTVRNREALLRSAMTLFRAQGFEATTIDQIAAGAGVSRRTFFRHFPSKDAAVFPNSDERIARFGAALRPAPGERPADGVRRAVLGMAREFTANKDELLLQYELIASSPLLLAREYEIDRRWEAVIYEALRPSNSTQRGPHPAGRKDMQARVLAGAIAGALRAVLRAWLASRGRLDLAALATDALETLATTLGSEGAA